MASADLRDEVTCSICLSVYTDPATLSCGHNFCRVCIDRVLDTQEGSGVYTLRNIAERFLSTRPEQKETGIFCTHCIHSPVPAVKTCLMCEASLCDDHLRVHSKSPEHVLSDPTTALGKRKCSVHKKILEYYCTEDSACICVTCCLAGEHQGHQVEPLIEASEKKKKELRNILEKLLSKRAETEKRVRSLQERRRKDQEKASGERERVTALIRDSRRRLEDLEKRVLSEISRQEERVSLSVSDLIRQLEIKKDELSRKMSHIEELGNMTDPVTVLQESDTGDLCDTEEGDNEDRERHDKQVHDIGGLDEGLISVTLHTGLADIVSSVKEAICMQEGSDILLDINTAGGNICSSDDLKTMTWYYKCQRYPETPERFQMYPQVLSKRRLSSGIHFLEWEGTRDSGSWSVGMSYPSIDRKGDQSCIGFNNKSWCLRCSRAQYSVIHDNNIIYLPHKPSCKSFRLYLDYDAGRLCFYELSDPIRHLHTFTADFTEPLHAAFYVWGDYTSIKIKNSDTEQLPAC